MKSGPVVPQVRLMQQYRLSVNWMSDLEVSGLDRSSASGSGTTDTRCPPSCTYDEHGLQRFRDVKIALKNAIVSVDPLAFC